MARLVRDSSPGLPPPSRDIPQCLAQSAQHPPWHLPHRYVFCCTAACSGHTTSLLPLCRALGCTTASPATPLCLPAAPLSQPAVRCRMMLRDAVPPTHYCLRPATASDPPSSSTCFPLVPHWRAMWRCTLHASIWFRTYFLNPLPCILDHACRQILILFSSDPLLGVYHV